MSGFDVKVLAIVSGVALTATLAWGASSALDAGPGIAATLTGIATAHDGDDVRFGKVRVRLQGIAAPEGHRNLREPGGAEATDHLRNLVDHRELTCLLDGETAGRNMRPSAICYLEAKILAPCRSARAMRGTVRDTRAAATPRPRPRPRRGPTGTI